MYKGIMHLVRVFRIGPFPANIIMSIVGLFSLQCIGESSFVTIPIVSHTDRAFVDLGKAESSAIEYEK